MIERQANKSRELTVVLIDVLRTIVRIPGAVLNAFLKSLSEETPDNSEHGN